MGAPQLQYAIPAGGGVPVGVAGAGTVNRLTKWTAATTIGDSGISDDGATVSFVARNLASTALQTTWTLPSDASALTLGGVLTLNTSQKRLGINCAPGTLLSVSDGIVSAPSYDGIRLGNAGEALFSSTEGVRTFRAGVTGSTVVVGSSTSHDLLLQRNNVTTLTLGASGADVVGTITSSGPIRATGTAATAPAFTGADTDTGLYFPAANQARISTAGSLAIAVDASQNVGIGATSLTHKLQVVGELGLYNSGTDGVYADVLFIGASPYQTTFRHKIKASVSATPTNALMTFSLNSGASSFIDLMTLRGDGNVGIGTAAPGGKLSILHSATNPNGLAAGTAIGALVLTNDGATAGSAYIRSAPLGTAAYDTGLQFGGYFYDGVSYKWTERMCIKGTGEVGIGTTSPTGRLHVVGGTAAAATNGAPVTIIAQSAGTGNQNGGNIVLTPGALSGTGSAGVADLSGPTGTGLKLPATPGNSDTQVLDAYSEIGTGSPVAVTVALSPASGTITLSGSGNKIRVTRIGNCVYGSGYLTVSAVSSPTGRLSFTLTGCPQAWINFPCTVTFATTNAIPAGSVWLVGSDTASPPTIYLDRYDGTSQLLDMAQYIKAGTAINISFVYQAA